MAGRNAVVSKSRVRTNKLKVRSAITNGHGLLPSTDGRTAQYRRFKDIASQLVIDFGSDLAEARLQLVRRFSACCVMAEMIEARMVSGEQYDADEHAKLVSSLCRLALKLGIDRVPKNCTPSLQQYLDAKAYETQEADE